MKKIFEINDKLIDQTQYNVFYGTGKRSRERMSALMNYGLRCDYLGDNDEQIWNTTVEGKHCLSHDEIRNREDINIIIGSKIFEKEIEKRLLEFGISTDRIFCDNYSEELGDQIVLGE